MNPPSPLAFPAAPEASAPAARRHRRQSVGRHAPPRVAARGLLPARLAVLLALGLAAAFHTDRLPAQEAADGEWIQLFNGRNLDGWKVKIKGYELGENFGNTFRVEDGLLTVSYDQYDQFNNRFGHLFYEQPCAHYRLRIEYRFIGDQAPGGPGWAFRNSGIMIHGQSPESMDKDQSFPVSIEVQLLGGRETGDRPTFNLCTPGTHVVLDGKLHTPHCTNSASPTYRGDQWVTGEIEVHGNRLIKHIVDGKTVLEYSQPQLDPGDADARKLIQDGNVQLSGGSISLQAESHPVQFRKVELLKLEE